MIDNNNISDLALDNLSDKSCEDYNNIFAESKIILSKESFSKGVEKINNEKLDKNPDNENTKSPSHKFLNNNMNLNDNSLNNSKKKKNISKSLFSYKNIFHKLKNSAFNPINKNINIITTKKKNFNLLAVKKNENIEKKDENSNFLCKKRNLFKIDKPNDFKIFSTDGNGNFTRKIIEETIQNFYISIFSESNAESEKMKKNALKIQNVQTRKENSDNIRKKIKSKFIKCLRIAVNERLIMAGSKKLFKLLPQIFVSNISKEKNKAFLNLSFKELFSQKFFEEAKQNENKFNLINYNHNLSVLDYLEKNDKISEKSNYKIFKDMKFHEIFNEYLKSNEFEKEIASLKKKKETDKYIKDYIIKASNLIEFFSN